MWNGLWIEYINFIIRSDAIEAGNAVKRGKIVIIGANDFQNQLILKAKARGLETHVFAWEDGAVGKYTADYFYPISIVKKEQILEICRMIEPDGIVLIASDLAVITVNYIAEKLNMVGNGRIWSLILPVVGSLHFKKREKRQK